MKISLPTRMDYRYASPAERRAILKLWREYNAAERKRMAADPSVLCIVTMPESHEDYLWEASRQKRLDEDYVEPRGFNDKTDGWDNQRGVRTGSIESWEYGE